jgi:hypothetical protein
MHPKRHENPKAKRPSVGAKAIDNLIKKAWEQEQDAFRMLDAIESEVGEIAIGPVVACNFEKSSIDLMFCIEGASTEDVHRRVGAVAEVVERVFAEGELRTSTAPTQDSEHASLCV